MHAVSSAVVIVLVVAGQVPAVDVFLLSVTPAPTNLLGRFPLERVVLGVAYGAIFAAKAEALVGLSRVFLLVSVPSRSSLLRHAPASVFR